MGPNPIPPGITSIGCSDAQECLLQVQTTSVTKPKGFEQIGKAEIT